LSNPGRPVLIPDSPSACCFLTFSKYAIADSRSVTSMSRIDAVFFFNSDVFVIRSLSATVPLLFWISDAADLIISFRLSVKYSP
jgi:hypothetical protein